MVFNACFKTLRKSVLAVHICVMSVLAYVFVWSWIVLYAFIVRVPFIEFLLLRLIVLFLNLPKHMVSLI